MIRCHRSLEEAQGQRRLVSFGGGITLSAGSSQGSNAGKRGSSQGDVCEISSDGSDGNDDDNGGDNGGSDDDNDAFVSPVKKAVHAGRRVRRRGDSDDASLGSTAVSPCQVGRESDPTHVGGQEPRRANIPRGTNGTSRADRRHSGKRRSARSSLAAFERTISGEDVCLDSPPRDGKWPLSRDGGLGGAKKGDASGEKGGGGGSDDSCEFVFTRVYRPSSSSPSARSRNKSPVEKGTPLRKEVGAGSSRSAGILSDSRGDSCDASDDESD